MAVKLITANMLRQILQKAGKPQYFANYIPISAQLVVDGKRGRRSHPLFVLPEDEQEGNEDNELNANQT
jgi:hypothetical protein